MEMLIEELRINYGIELSIDIIDSMISSDITKIANAIKNIVYEQLWYIHKFGPNCRAWYILALHNKNPLGGICAFYNPNYEGHTKGSSYIMIQAITKYTVPFLMSVLDEDYANSLPKVNAVLEPAIEYLAKSLKVDYIYVHPIGTQGRILQQRYGYKKLPSEYILQLPCDVIFHASERFVERYYKQVEDDLNVNI
jgi:hypothetical protein